MTASRDIDLSCMPCCGDTGTGTDTATEPCCDAGPPPYTAWWLTDGAYLTAAEACEHAESWRIYRVTWNGVTYYTAAPAEVVWLLYWEDDSDCVWIASGVQGETLTVLVYDAAGTLCKEYEVTVPWVVWEELDGDDGCDTTDTDTETETSAGCCAEGPPPDSAWNPTWRLYASAADACESVECGGCGSVYELEWNGRTYYCVYPDNMYWALYWVDGDGCTWIAWAAVPGGMTTAYVYDGDGDFCKRETVTVPDPTWSAVSCGTESSSETASQTQTESETQGIDPDKWYCVALAFWFMPGCDGEADVIGPACVTGQEILDRGGIGVCTDWGGYYGSYTEIKCGPLDAEADCTDPDLCPECT